LHSLGVASYPSGEVEETEQEAGSRGQQEEKGRRENKRTPEGGKGRSPFLFPSK